MQQQQTRNVGVITAKVRIVWLPYAVFTVAVAVTLFGIFSLSAWAETSGWHHAAQHVLIFTSGFSAGGSILSLFGIKKEQ